MWQSLLLESSEFGANGGGEGGSLLHPRLLGQELDRIPVAVADPVRGFGVPGV